jgi:predicted enzyme related to lactoylglutathione lyase
MPIRFKAAVPQFPVPDVVRTAEYYRDVLGFTIAGYWNSPPAFGIVRRDAVEVFFNHDAHAAPWERAGYDAYFHVDDVDELAEELKRNGADIVDGPEDRIYEQRELVVRDCNGLILCFGESIPIGATQH